MAASIGVRTAAVLFTDLAESTVIRSRLGEVAAERLRVVHDGVVRRAIEAAGGTVVKSLGDGLMATFVSAADAVAAAVAVQQGIDRHNRRSGAERLQVRVGVSVGDVDFDGTDCHGLPVVEAQRLESAARPGQILCADLVVALARGRGGHVFEPVGSLVLKGLAAPLAASSVAWEPLAGSGDADLPPVLRQAAGLPMSGRRAEAAVLAEAWARCRDGGFAVVVVGGEPGIGKTRLVSEAAAEAQADGAVVLAGRCDEDIRLPFGPFVGALRWMVEQVPSEELPHRLGPQPGELSMLVPEIIDLVAGVVPAAPADAETEQLRLFDAVRSWLSSSGTTASVLVLDDLHWADTGTVLLLRHLVRAAPARLLVLGTYRDTDLSRAHPLGAALGEMRRAGSVSRVVLRGLDERDVRDLVEVATGHALSPPGVAFADLVREETAGNPLFVGEVLRHLAESGSLVFDDDRWTSPDGLASIGIPEGVREVIGRRLSLLDLDTEAVLRTAAIVGLEFDLPLLAAVLGEPETDVLDALEAAVFAALVVEVGVDTFRFAHALVRDTLHSELSSSRRAREHGRVARAIEQRHAGDLDRAASELALHWGEACAGGDPTVAVEWAARAGERDLTRRAPAEAARWFARALELLDDDQSNRAQRRSLLSRLAFAQARAHDPAATSSASAAAALALDAGDVVGAADDLCLSVRSGGYTEGLPSDEVRITLLRRTLDLLGDDDVLLRGRLLSRLAGEMVFARDFAQREVIVEEILALIDTVDDPVGRWRLMGGGVVGTGRKWADRAAMEKVRHYCDEAMPCLVDDFERVGVQTLLWMVCVALGDRDGADHALRALAQENTPAARSWHQMLAATTAYLDGELDDYERLSQRVVEGLDAFGAPTASYVWYGNNLLLMRERATMAALRTSVEHRVAEHGPIPTYPNQPMLAIEHLYAGELELVRLDAAAVERDYDDDGRGWWETILIEVVVAIGDERLVRLVLPRVEPFHGMHLVSGGIYCGPYDRLAALLRDRLGDHDDADAAFARAVQACHRLRTPLWVARTELDWAESLLRRGDRSAASAHVRDARVAIGDLPLTDSRNRAERLDAQLA